MNLLVFISQIIGVYFADFRTRNLFKLLPRHLFELYKDLCLPIQGTLANATKRTWLRSAVLVEGTLLLDYFCTHWLCLKVNKHCRVVAVEVNTIYIDFQSVCGVIWHVVTCAEANDTFASCEWFDTWSVIAIQKHMSNLTKHLTHLNFMAARGVRSTQLTICSGVQYSKYYNYKYMHIKLFWNKYMRTIISRHQCNIWIGYGALLNHRIFKCINRHTQWWLLWLNRWFVAVFSHTNL